MVLSSGFIVAVCLSDGPHTKVTKVFKSDSKSKGDVNTAQNLRERLECAPTSGSSRTECHFFACATSSNFFLLEVGRNSSPPFRSSPDVRLPLLHDVHQVLVRSAELFLRAIMASEQLQWCQSFYQVLVIVTLESSL